MNLVKEFFKINWLILVVQAAFFYLFWFENSRMAELVLIFQSFIFVFIYCLESTDKHYQNEIRKISKEVYDKYSWENHEN